MNVLLTRANHDRLLNAPILAHLFATYGRRWGLAGVTFYNVNQEDRDALNAAVGA